MAARHRMQILIGFTLIVCGIVALVRILDQDKKADHVILVQPRAESDPAALPPLVNPTEPIATPPSAVSSPGADTTTVVAAKLIIPVAGVTPEQLLDTFTHERSEGRTHEAIDIPAALGTPVLAAVDGRIIKLFLSEAGGITIYQLGTDDKTVYYYAHLDRYEEGLSEGQSVKQGEVIAYVGDTGNAERGNYHLHFSISVVSDPNRLWEGMYVNPYPLLTEK